MSCVYFVLWLPEDQPSITTAFVKILPILSLVWFVCLQGVSGEAQHSYNRKILVGLLFSIVGDTVLVWQQDIVMFLGGMLCFGFALLAYICAFGFTPFGLKELVGCSFIFAIASTILAMTLPSPLVHLVLSYAFILLLLNWRSHARFNIKGEIPWRKIFAACGAGLFFVSDFCIAINKFVYEVPGERAIIMTTYYAAQLCLSLSVINSRLSTHTKAE